MSDQEVRLDHLLKQLEEGHLSTEDAARQLRVMTFPVKAARTNHQRWEDEIGDPEVPEPGSFFAISQAYTEGRISRRQYEALAEAAAASIKARGRQAPSQSNSSSDSGDDSGAE